MVTNDPVALIVDPEFGTRIRDVAARVRHTWVVATPANIAVAEQIWRALTNPPGLGNEGAVTTFLQYGADRESWCDAILDAVDDHHSAHSRNPGYSILEVYGTPLTERLRPTLVELGFSIVTPTDYGFCARKEPT
ncbi:hypothetical protein [Burkholderia cepacia]|uniref:hypothetical protein n=1 Tax=Burkholderia cepacia TaxID=292 RepID=UPI002FE31C42